MKRLISILLILLMLGAIAFFFVAGKVVDCQMNKTTLTALPEVSEQAKKLHKTLNIARFYLF